MYLQLLKVIGVTLMVLPLLESYVESANILYVMPFPAMSHYMFLKSIGLELAHRGHNITIITSHIEKDAPPNYHQIKVVDVYIWSLVYGGAPDILKFSELPSEDFYYAVWQVCPAFTDHTLNSPEVKQFLKKDNQFDLILVEQMYQEAMYALSVKYNAPLALISTFGNSMKHNIMQANPLQLATVVQEYLRLPNPSSFWGRMRNFYFTTWDYFWYKYWYLGIQEALFEKHFPELIGKTPPLYDLQKDSSLMLINSHFSYDTPFAMLPNIVEIGGAHLSRSNATLPEDLQKLLDESKQGVVYVNFGTNVKSTHFPKEKLHAFLNVFKRLKQTVLFKWEDDLLEGKPKNLVIRKWFPQKEVLAHPNIKVFVAHGGLFGMQEAIFNGVPVIGVPIYGDQFNNVLLAQEAGMGKVLLYSDINEKNVNRLLSEVLNNDSYMKNAKDLQRSWQDRPLSPMDTAMFWLEYVIRNKGAEYMKNPARNMSWFAYTLLDVYAFLLATFVIAAVVLFKFVNLVRSLLSGSNIEVTDRKKFS